MIEYDPKNALMLDTPERFIEIWKSSGAKEFCSWNRWPKLPPEGWFHPRTTRYFSEWAKQKGYDAVIIPHAAFVGEDGFREVGGVFGDPQAIILNPHIIQAITELEELEEIYG